MSSADIIARSDRSLFQVYARIPLALVRGEGSRVWDGDDRCYLDFFSSTVVTALGHCHPALIRAIETQARKILHVSNLHYSEPQTRLAELLVKHSFADRVFLCNSGAEANEAAIKLARRYGQRDGAGRYEILTALGSFHGRTLATITATGQEKVRVGFEPLPRGFRYVPFDDVAAIADALGKETIAVMVEPVQGEGGIRVPRPEYLREVRALCDRRGLLLILDEVQTGMGRTGPLFAHEHSGIRPDIITLAKGLGGGIPIGAMLATEEVAQGFTVGSHASTFGGNALTCAAAVAVVETLVNEGVLANCEAMGTRLRDGLNALRAKHSVIKDVRGQGLLIGAELEVPAAETVDRCLQAGLIINGTAQTVLRFAPPLTVTAAEIDEALAIVDRVFLGMKRDFLSLAELTRAEVNEIVAISARIKSELKAGNRTPLLAGKTLVMIFEKPSLRTRVTFEVGMTQLGGYAVYLTPTDIRLGERESVPDIARNLERWVDFIMARTFAHNTLVDLAKHARTPVVNGLSDLCHPCQVLCDCFTLIERWNDLAGRRVAFLGDGNNMANSWINAAVHFGFTFAIACPSGYEPDENIVRDARARGANIVISSDPAEALHNADAVYTDVWTSMGQEDETAERRRVFRPYQVNRAAMDIAKPDAVVMHCLPAHRGEEITGDVIDGPQSIVFDEAENRLHVQKGILVWLNEAKS